MTPKPASWMSDENAAKLRAKLIAEKVITPSTQMHKNFERPLMNKDVVLRLRASMIKQGVLMVKRVVIS